MKHTLGLATLALTLASGSAFAQNAPCANPQVSATVRVAVPGPAVAPAVAPAVYAQPQPAYVPVAQPAYVPAPVVVQPAYAQPAQPVYVPTTTPVAAGWGEGHHGRGGWRRAQQQSNPLGIYTAQVRARVQLAQQQLQANVSQASVQPQALQVFSVQQSRMEQLLAFVASDGVLLPQEQAQVEGLLQRMERLDERFRVQTFRGGQRWGMR